MIIFYSIAKENCQGVTALILTGLYYGNIRLQNLFFLSGGIGPEDKSEITSIISLNLPLYAIDINSKFEIEPGLKNIELIKKFKAKL